MIIDYLILDLPIDSNDEEIRKRYIELVKKYTPEKEPERFQKITSAYEAIKNERRRILDKLFGGFRSPDYEKDVLDLVKAKNIKKRRATLKELLEYAK